MQTLEQLENYRNDSSRTVGIDFTCELQKYYNAVGHATEDDRLLHAFYGMLVSRGEKYVSEYEMSVLAKDYFCVCL